MRTARAAKTALTNQSGAKMPKRLDSTVEVALSKRPVRPEVRRELRCPQCLPQTSAIRQSRRKGEFAARTHRFHSGSNLLSVPDAGSPQPRVRRLMHDSGGNHIRRRRVRKHKAGVELASA